MSYQGIKPDPILFRFVGHVDSGPCSCFDTHCCLIKCTWAQRKRNRNYPPYKSIQEGPWVIKRVRGGSIMSFSRIKCWVQGEWSSDSLEPVPGHGILEVWVPNKLLVAPVIRNFLIPNERHGNFQPSVLIELLIGARRKIFLSIFSLVHFLKHFLM